VDPLVAHQRAQDAFAAVLANAKPDQLDDPTPCSAWTVRDLIDHVVAGNRMVVARAGRGEDPPPRSDNVAEAHRASAAWAQETFAGPEGMSAIYELPFGQVPGAAFIGMRTTDVLTHAWDLAAATGQSTDLDRELATHALAAAQQAAGAGFRGPGKPFGEQQPCPPNRSPADRLAAFLGRTVG